jgi:argonaute-like protein implicated in RNA metabolism and viral defense
MVNIIKILIVGKLIEEIQKESWEIIGGYEWKRQIYFSRISFLAVM